MITAEISSIAYTKPGRQGTSAVFNVSLWAFTISSWFIKYIAALIFFCNTKWTPISNNNYSAIRIIHQTAKRICLLILNTELHYRPISYDLNFLQICHFTSTTQSNPLKTKILGAIAHSTQPNRCPCSDSSHVTAPGLINCRLLLLLLLLIRGSAKPTDNVLSTRLSVHMVNGYKIQVGMMLQDCNAPVLPKLDAIRHCQTIDMSHRLLSADEFVASSPTSVSSPSSADDEVSIWCTSDAGPPWCGQQATSKWHGPSSKHYLRSLASFAAW